MSSQLSLDDYRALAEFRYQIRCFLNFGEQAARAAGLEPQQYVMLLTIRGLPAGKQATVRALAERLQIRHHSAVELIDRLAQRGLVRRARAPQDRRNVVIHLTARGERILEKLAQLRLTELRATGPNLVRALDALIERTREAEPLPHAVQAAFD